MFNDDDIHPQRSVQRVENFWEQRKAYRLAALIALRKREGLPSPVDEHNNPLETRMDDFGNAYYVSPDGTRVEKVLFANSGKDGKPGSFATGTRKGEARELADAHWNSSDPGFEILEVAEDGRTLANELNDLDRDSKGMEIAQQVSHGIQSEQAPGFDLAGTSDEEVDQKLQEYLKREGVRGY
jgi:hypothetical protein